MYTKALGMERSPEPPASKKLRSGEPDLKVILGSDEGGAPRSVHFCHSAALATRSGVIDAMLSAPMLEREQRTLTFPDLDDGAWTRMWKYVDDPTEARAMTAGDAAGLAPLYDKYDIRAGMRLCDGVLADYFRSAGEQEERLELDVGFLVDAIRVCLDANLREAFNVGILYYLSKACDLGYSHRKAYHRTMFTKEQLTKLAPCVEHAREIWDSIRKFQSPQFFDPFFVGNLSERVVAKLDKPEETIREWRAERERRFLENCTCSVEITGTDCEVDGVFAKAYWPHLEYFPNEGGERVVNWCGESYEPSIRYLERGQWRQKDEIPANETPEKDNHTGWAVVLQKPYDEEEDIEFPLKICWIAVNSAGLRHPPSRGWKGYDAAARGKPVLKYSTTKESIEF